MRGRLAALRRPGGQPGGRGLPVLAVVPGARRSEPQSRPGWYVNGQGQTLTLVDGSKPFLMGSPAVKRAAVNDEKLHWRQIGRRYAIGTKPVTRGPVRAIPARRNPEVKHLYDKQYSPDADGPIIAVTWYEAAQYCRWLSEQEGFPEQEMVYPARRRSRRARTA